LKITNKFTEIVNDFIVLGTTLHINNINQSSRLNHIQRFTSTISTRVQD